MGQVKSLYNSKNNNAPQDAQFLCEEKYIKNLIGYGKKGIFFGYLTFISGNVSLDKLRDCNNRELKCNKIFVISQCVWRLDLKEKNSKYSIEQKDSKEHIIILSRNLPVDLYGKNDAEIKQLLELNNITIVTQFQSEMMAENINFDCNYIDKQHTMCAIINIDVVINNSILNDTKQKLNEIDEFEKNNFLSNYKIKKPLFFKKYKTKQFIDNLQKTSLLKTKKTVAIFDFGISPILLDIFRTYFNVMLLPRDTTAKRTNYLLIDGILISNGIMNNDILNDNDVQRHIAELIKLNIPILGIGCGGCLIGKITGNTIMSYNDFEYYNNFIVYDNMNKQYFVSNCYSKCFKDIAYGFSSIFYDDKNNIVGIKKDKILCFTFDFCDNNFYTEYMLSMFDKMMHGDQ